MQVRNTKYGGVYKLGVDWYTFTWACLVLYFCLDKCDV